MGYIGHHGIAALHKYKYSGVDNSLVAKYILQPFWSRFVNIFPLWVPPNMITLTGFLFVLFSALLGYGRMILAHLCDEPKGLKTGMCMSLLFLPLAIANALTAWLNDGTPLIDEFVILLLYCAYTVGLYFHFATSVIHEITNALGIYCFRITRKEA